MQYRADIDGLRALAVGGVVLFHAGLPFAHLPGGYLGVDVFFVISGFLITTILAREVEEGRFTYRDFYARRVRRILPALVAVLAGSVAAACVWLMPKDLEAMREGLLATLLFGSNFFFWNEVGYFERAAELRPLIHTWSLAIEEQFYLFFPLAFLLVWRWFGPRGRLLVPLAVSLVSLLAAEWAVRWDPATAFFWTPFRVWEFGAGIVLAQSGWRPRSRGTAEGGAALGLALVAGAMLLFDENAPVPGLLGLVPVLGAVLLIGMRAPDGAGPTLAARLLSVRPLVGIGLVSYSLYLWHQPVLAIARLRAAAEPEPLVLVGLVALTGALAWATWRFVEQPFRHPRTVGSRPFAGAALAGLVALVAAYVALDDGWLGRFDPQTQRILASGKRYDARVEPCIFDTNGVGDPRCLFAPTAGAGASAVAAADAAAAPGSRPRVTLIGDSHALALASGLVDALDGRGVAMELRARSGCPMVRGMRRSDWRKDCAETAERFAALPPVATGTVPEIVVVASRWPSQMWGTGFDNGEGGRERLDMGPLVPVGAGRASDDMDERVRVMGAHLERQVAAYLAQGRRVVLVHSLPVHGWDVPSRVATLHLRHGEGRRPLSVPRALFEERARPAERALASVPDAPGLLRVRPADVFCRNGACVAEGGGLPFYSDDDHLNPHGARLLADRIVEAMDARGWLEAPVTAAEATVALR